MIMSYFDGLDLKISEKALDFVWINLHEPCSSYIPDETLEYMCVLQSIVYPLMCSDDTWRCLRLWQVVGSLKITPFYVMVSHECGLNICRSSELTVKVGAVTWHRHQSSLAPFR